MPEQIDRELKSHQDAEELLPWYASGQLAADEQALVERHLASCAECRAQLGFDRRMIDEFAAMSPEVDSGWARLRQRIEPRQSFARKIALDAEALWQSLRRPPVAALAVAQLAFVVVAASVLLSLSRPSYHALGSAPAPASANVIVIFRADTTESQLRGLLRANGASLVGGPTSTNAYLLRVPASSREKALANLQADAHVSMAQPIDGSTS
jgi:anti-sigma-K factor RskA